MNLATIQPIRYKVVFWTNQSHSYCYCCKWRNFYPFVHRKFSLSIIISNSKISNSKWFLNYTSVYSDWLRKQRDTFHFSNFFFHFAADDGRSFSLTFLAARDLCQYIFVWSLMDLFQFWMISYQSFFLSVMTCTLWVCVCVRCTCIIMIYNVSRDLFMGQRK